MKHPDEADRDRVEKLTEIFWDDYLVGAKTQDAQMKCRALTAISLREIAVQLKALNRNDQDRR